MLKLKIGPWTVAQVSQASKHLQIIPKQAASISQIGSMRPLQSGLEQRTGTRYITEITRMSVATNQQMKNPNTFVKLIIPNIPPRKTRNMMAKAKLLKFFTRFACVSGFIGHPPRVTKPVLRYIFSTTLTSLDHSSCGLRKLG